MPVNALSETAPSNLEAERTVIGALLLDPEAIFKIDARLRHNDFHDPAHGAIYKVIQQLSEKGSPVDFVTVSDGIKGNEKIERIGGSAYLAEIASGVPTASHIDKYADIVIEYSRKRQLARLGRRLADLAYAEDTQSACEILEQAEKEFLQISHDSDTQPATLADMRNERFDRYTTLYEADDPTEHYGTRTGFPALDNLLTALAPGHLTVLAGRPSMGKTAMALDIARFVGSEQQKVVAIFSLEMTKEQVFDRMFGKLSAIAPWKLTKGMLTEEQFNTMGASFDRLENQHIYIDDDPNRTLVNIRSKARRLKMQHPLDLLIIDYLQLINVKNRAANENQTQRITFISESLKQLARELECPILALSQLSRECDRRPDKRPQLSDLRDSGSIEQDADHVLMLYRAGYYDEDIDEPDVTDVYVRKNRHGPIGHVELQFDKENMSFAP